MLTRRLLATPVTPNQVTLAYTVTGLLAAALLARGRRPALLLGGALLLVKSTLDAVDGSLARARGRPSRVGRLLDSLCDLLVNAAVCLGLAWPRRSFGLAAAALASATWQATAFNYYAVYHRQLAGGESTSRVDESAPGGYPWDDPRALRVLHTLYNLAYGWQDRLLARLDRRLVPDSRSPVYSDRRLLTLTTAMGTGAQLLVVALCAALGRPRWALWAFVGPLNLYWAALMLYRRRRALAAAPTADERR